MLNELKGILGLVLIFSIPIEFFIVFFATMECVTPIHWTTPIVLGSLVSAGFAIILVTYITALELMES